MSLIAWYSPHCLICLTLSQNILIIRNDPHWQLWRILPEMEHIIRYSPYCKKWTILPDEACVAKYDPNYQICQHCQICPIYQILHGKIKRGQVKNNTPAHTWLYQFCFLLLQLTIWLFDSLTVSLMLSPFHYDELTEPISTSVCPFFVSRLLWWQTQVFCCNPKPHYC